MSTLIFIFLFCRCAYTQLNCGGGEPVCTNQNHHCAANQHCIIYCEGDNSCDGLTVYGGTASLLSFQPDGISLKVNIHCEAATLCQATCTLPSSCEELSMYGGTSTTLTYTSFGSNAAVNVFCEQTTNCQIHGHNHNNALQNVKVTGSFYDVDIQCIGIAPCFSTLILQCSSGQCNVNPLTLNSCSSPSPSSCDTTTSPTTASPTTAIPTSASPTTQTPTAYPTTSTPTTSVPTTSVPTSVPTMAPTTSVPTTANPTTMDPITTLTTTYAPTLTTVSPTNSPVVDAYGDGVAAEISTTNSLRDDGKNPISGDGGHGFLNDYDLIIYVGIAGGMLILVFCLMIGWKRIRKRKLQQENIEGHMKNEDVAIDNLTQIETEMVSSGEGNNVTNTHQINLVDDDEESQDGSDPLDGDDLYTYTVPNIPTAGNDHNITTKGGVMEMEYEHEDEDGADHMCGMYDKPQTNNVTSK